MGGPSMQDALNPVITARLAKARRITEEQLRIATEIVTSNLGPGVNFDALPAILQALATNYHATVHASKD